MVSFSMEDYFLIGWLEAVELRRAPIVKSVPWDGLDDPRKFVCDACKHFILDEVPDKESMTVEQHASCYLGIDLERSAVIECSRYERRTDIG